LVLLAVGNWFPAVGLDVFNYQHVRLAVLAALATTLAVVISALSLLWHRNYQAAVGTVALLQLLAPIAAIYALRPWPGGDDGCMIGWEGIVIPSMSVVALAGVVASLLMVAQLIKSREARGE